MLNQLIISLILILFCINAVATETEKPNEQPQKTENEQPQKTEQDPKPQKGFSERSKESIEKAKRALARRTTGEELLPDFQKIDALNDNDYCFIDSSWLVLGRTEANQTVTLEIVAKENSEQEVKRDLLAGEAFMTWPMDALPVKDGAVYLVSINNDSHNLTLHPVAADPRITNDFNEFDEKKCWRQILLMSKNEKNH